MDLLISPSHQSIRQVPLSSPLSTWGYRGSETHSDWPKATQLISGRTRADSQVCFLNPGWYPDIGLPSGQLSADSQAGPVPLWPAPDCARLLGDGRKALRVLTGPGPCVIYKGTTLHGVQSPSLYTSQKEARRLDEGRGAQGRAVWDSGCSSHVVKTVSGLLQAGLILAWQPVTHKLVWAGAAGLSGYCPEG